MVDVANVLVTVDAVMIQVSLVVPDIRAVGTYIPAIVMDVFHVLMKISAIRSGVTLAKTEQRSEDHKNTQP